MGVAGASRGGRGWQGQAEAMERQAEKAQVEVAEAE